ncbi:MAG: zinc-ribbon domain-containing protein [Clostridia bacterium]|nr:zinc-ribbon domain-containing protein [Clostridia bacterium]
MFCKNCGREINDSSVVCPHCGVQVGKFNSDEHSEGNALAIVGFVFSFLIAIVGLICSILGYNNAKKGAPYKNLALAGIIISIVSMALYVVILVISCAAIATVV